MKGFTCIEDKCDFKNDCQIIRYFYEKGRVDAIEEYTDWLFNEGYIGLHWNNPTNAIQNLLNKYKEQIQKGKSE